jgi:hypothetical protein
MTSGSDDLEQELRRNLKLRRELGAEAAKGKAALDDKERGGVAYRLGWVLYWACLALIGLYAAFWLVVLQDASWEGIISDLKDWTTVLGLALSIVGLYALGRAFRYVLSGE